MLAKLATFGVCREIFGTILFRISGKVSLVELSPLNPEKRIVVDDILFKEAFKVKLRYGTEMNF